MIIYEGNKENKIVRYLIENNKINKISYPLLSVLPISLIFFLNEL